jgi:hypothetical protein
MCHRVLPGLLFVVQVIAGAPARAEDLSPTDSATTAPRIAARIDELIAAGWQAQQVAAAPLADDAEFFRRLNLDLCGRIPRAAEVRDFLADQQPDKRARATERLLQSPAFVIHQTNLWRAAMLPEAAADDQVRAQLPGFEAWLRSRIVEQRSFADICREILTLPLPEQDRANLFQPDRPTPVAFYSAKEFKVESLAAASSRLFLGVRLDCAQCHDHPFDRWKQPEFWSFAALFQDVPGFDAEAGRLQPAAADRTSIAIPDKGVVVHARFLDGQSPNWESTDSGRELVANWMTAPGNPYFARAVVNRLWAGFFGIGLVEPMDDFSDHNPPSHPELLDLLAHEFEQHGHDLTLIARAITLSKTYQLTSRQTDPSQSDPRLFSRMAVRGLSPEQLFDSLAQATGYRQPFDPEQPLNFNNDATRQELIALFASEVDSPTQKVTTILQALALMNGEFVGNATDLADSRTLAAIHDAPFLSETDRIESIFLTTLSRYPTPAERTRCLDYLQQGGAHGDAAAALTDLFWALLNSSEFRLNH